MSESIACPKCTRVSYHLQDIAQRYCGACHEFHDYMQLAPVTCACGETDCDYVAFGYPWCPACREHHRPPQCAIDSEGRSLAPDGRPWSEIFPTKTKG